MKSAVLSVALLLSFACHAGPVEFSEIREADLPSSELFDAASQWIAETYTSAEAVIEHKDRASGTIIGNGISKIDWMWSTVPLRYKLRLDIKDNKFRLTLSNFLLPDAGNKPIEDANRTSLEPKAGDLTKSLADSLQAYSVTHKSKANW